MKAILYRIFMYALACAIQYGPNYIEATLDAIQYISFWWRLSSCLSCRRSYLNSNVLSKVTSMKQKRVGVRILYDTHYRGNFGCYCIYVLSSNDDISSHSFCQKLLHWNKRGWESECYCIVFIQTIKATLDAIAYIIF